MVWRVRADDEWLYLYLMMEFQSTVDHGMPVRILSYLGLLYQSLIRKEYVKPRRGIPPGAAHRALQRQNAMGCAHQD